MKNLLVIKISGNIIDDEKALNTFLNDFASIDTPKILIHGGGKLATELSSKLGIETNLVNGRRITDSATIQVVTMTYAGWINKSITSSLQAKNCNAIGLSGADVQLLPAVKRPAGEIDYGFVGDILNEQVNSEFLKLLLSAGITPIIAPITCDGTGQLLNVNADTVAQSVAVALSKSYSTHLIYCFEKNGLLSDVADDTSVIPELNTLTAEKLKADGVISKGMTPKVDNALMAIKSGVNKVVIGHAVQITKIAKGEKGYGTYITG